MVSVPFSRERGFSGRSNLPYFCAGACSSMWTVEDVGSTHRADLLETALSGFHIPDRASTDPGWLVFIVWLVGPSHGQSRVELGTGLTTRVRFGSLKRGDRRSIPKKGPFCASFTDAESVDEDCAGKVRSAKSKSVDAGLSPSVPQKGVVGGGSGPSDARGSKIGNDTGDSIFADFGVSDAIVASTADSGAVSPDRTENGVRFRSVSGSIIVVLGKHYRSDVAMGLVRPSLEFRATFVAGISFPKRSDGYSQVVSHRSKRNYSGVLVSIEIEEDRSAVSSCIGRMGVGLDLQPPSRISDPTSSDSARLMWVDLPICKHGRDCDIHFQFMAENFNPINMLATGRLDGKVRLSAVMSCISIPLRLFEPCLGYWFG